MRETIFVWDSVNDCVMSELDGSGAVQVTYTNERPAYTKQCIALYEQFCCDSPCPDSRGCYGPPFMDPPRKPNDPIPDKQQLIDGCVRKLMPQSTGPANQQAFQQFCGQN